MSSSSIHEKLRAWACNNDIVYSQLEKLMKIFDEQISQQNNCDKTGLQMKVDIEEHSVLDAEVKDDFDYSPVKKKKKYSEEKFRCSNNDQINVDENTSAMNIVKPDPDLYVIDNNDHIIFPQSNPVNSSLASYSPDVSIDPLNNSNNDFNNVSLQSIHNALTSLKTSMDNNKKIIMDVLNDVVRKQDYLIALIESSPLPKNMSYAYDSDNDASFYESYNIVLPLPTIKDFITFNQRLAEDEEFRKYFIKSLSFYWNPKDKTLSRRITSLFKKIFSREVATQFTCTKKLPHKLLLKETEFHQCLLAFLRRNDNSSMDEIMKTIGVVLSNARDWNGCRHSREVKDMEKR